MNGASRTGMLSIGQVVAALREVYPDVSHSSLRFLEGEGLLAPLRTPGGHRLYRPSDVDRVRTIRTWQGQRLSLAEIRERLAQLDALPAPEALARRFLERALTGDGAGAAHEILRADELGVPMAVLFDQVLRPALLEVGDRWAAGALGVGQEHEVSELARDLVAELSLRHARPRAGMPAVVAACPAGEAHDLGLRMVCGALREQGARVHFLGVSVAPTFLIETIALRRPDAVLLSVTLPEHRPALADACRAIRELASPPRVVVGGQGSPSVSGGDAVVVPGVALAAAARDILALASPASP